MTKSQRDYYAELVDEIIALPGFETPPGFPDGAVKKLMVITIRKRSQEFDMFFDEENFGRIKADLIDEIKKLTRVN